MNKLLVILSLLFIGCSSTSQQENDKPGSKPKEDTIAVSKPINGVKWKADETTRANVALVRQLVYDSAYAGGKNNAQLAKELQARIDLLVQQCTMQGQAHETLHQWLQTILKDIKELKEEEAGEEEKPVKALQGDVDQFNVYFE
jgi:hypothetical protein